MSKKPPTPNKSKPSSNQPLVQKPPKLEQPKTRSRPSSRDRVIGKLAHSSSQPSVQKPPKPEQPKPNSRPPSRDRIIEKLAHSSSQPSVQKIHPKTSSRPSSRDRVIEIPVHSLNQPSVQKTHPTPRSRPSSRDRVVEIPVHLSNQPTVQKIHPQMSSNHVSRDRVIEVPVQLRMAQPLPIFPFTNEAQRLNHDRTPQRIVHGKGAAAFGVFDATHDISDICKAKVFRPGTRTRVITRFSIGCEGNTFPDTVREARGFAVKMYTEDGIWDFLGSSSPVFLIRNPDLFSALAQAQKRDPQTHAKNHNVFWNFVATNPQTLHHILIMHSDRGTPDGFRFMHGYGSHTFKMINDRNQYFWVKFHFRSDQNIKNLDPNTSRTVAGGQLYYAAADLHNAIATRNFPSWTLYVQVMTDEQARNVKFDPFDMTKIFPKREFPLRQVGKLTLHENPTDYVTQMEHVAFSPTHMPPGIEPSSDKVLQFRLTQYKDPQARRVGPNDLAIPVNNPQTNQNFRGNPFHQHFTQTPGNVQNGVFDATVFGQYMMLGEDDFSQPRDFYQRVLDNQGRANLINNIAETLGQCTDRNIIHRILGLLSHIDRDFGPRMAERIRF